MPTLMVSVLTAAAPLAATVTMPGLPRRGATARGHRVLAARRTSALVRPATIFAASASAAGVVVTYLPLAVTGRAACVAAAGLFLQPAASTAGRWVAGPGGRPPPDRAGVARRSTVDHGMTAMAATSSAPLVTAGAATFGAGLGIPHNATLSHMYACVCKARCGTVSAVWNASYDTGIAAGTIGAGLLVTGTGYTAMFLIAVATMLPALAMARREAAPQLDLSSAAAPALGTEPVSA